MKNIMLVAGFIFFYYTAERQDILDPKLPVALTVRPFSQQAELATMLNDKLQEKKITVVSVEKADAIVKSEIEGSSRRRYDQVSRQITPENILELTKKSIAEIPYVVQRLIVTVVLNRDMQFDSCYYTVRGLPAHNIKVVKTIINDSIVKKNDLNLLASTIVELSTRKP